MSVVIQWFKSHMAVVAIALMLLSFGMQIASASWYHEYERKPDAQSADNISSFHTIARFLALLAISVAVLAMIKKNASAATSPTTTTTTANVFMVVCILFIVATIILAVLNVKYTNSFNKSDLFDAKKFENWATIFGLFAISSSILIVAM